MSAVTVAGLLLIAVPRRPPDNVLVAWIAGASHRTNAPQHTSNQELS